jgi:hypothetical protein
VKKNGIPKPADRPHKRATRPQKRATRPQKRGTRTRGIGSLLVIAAAILVAVIPVPAAIVERFYATGVYGLFQPAVTFASNAAPFAWLDVLLLAVVGALLLLTARDTLSRGWRPAAGLMLLRLVVWTAALYLVFVGAWGLNYRRQRLTDRLPYDAAAVTPAAAARLATLAVDRVNALHGVAHAQGWVNGNAIDPALAGSFDRVARDLGITRRGIVVGRPKRSLLDWYFQRTGVAGMTNPILLETIVAGDLLPFERPLVVAHEWSHLAGVTDEGEANLIGWLACIRGSAADQYSGWLFMYGESIATLNIAQRTPIVARLAAGPRDDLRAMRERTLSHVNPTLSTAGWRVYDSYLKANRVESGAASYAEVVRLALGLTKARPF